jgi:hypothetical protein
VADLKSYRKMEWAMARRRPDHLYAIAYIASLAILTAIALPRMPNVIPRFFQRTLQIGTWADIALFNMYAATYVITLVVSTIDLLRIRLLPYEEGYLSVYLSKPISPVQYLRARFVPVLVNAALMSLAAQAATGLSVWHLIGPFNRSQFLWSSLLIVGLILFLLCLLNYLFLFVRESYYGFVLSIVCWTVALAPASLYVYRPDLFSYGLRVYVFPANLLWHHSPVIETAIPLVLTLCCGSALLYWVSALTMRRSPLR